MNKKELAKARKKTGAQLSKQLEELKIKRSQFIASLATGEEKNTKKGKLMKRDIAQLMTIIKEQ